jgi:hypothetical protein
VMRCASSVSSSASARVRNSRNSRHSRVPPIPQHLIYFQAVGGASRDLEDVGLGGPRRLFHAAARRERWRALDEAPLRSAAAMV